MAQFKPIPLILPSGVQPYSVAGGQPQGAALQAMLRGGTLFGVNPADVRRATQVGAQQRPRSVLDMLRYG